MRSIGDCAFLNCTNLTVVAVSNGVTTFGKNTFNGCTSLTEVTIPEGVTEICDGLFYGCSQLSELYLPASIETIASNAFEGCDFSRLVIYCYQYTPADGWAQEQGLKVVYLDEQPEGQPLTLSLPEGVQVGRGQSYRLVPRVFPYQAGYTYAWKSSNEDVAAVDEQGVVTFVSAGQATITVSLGELTASTVVTCQIPCDTLTLGEGTLWLQAGTTYDCAAQYTPADTTETFSYTSSKPAVVTVDASGKLTAKSVGESLITVVASASGRTSVRPVSVCYPIKSVSIDRTCAAVEPGETLPLTVTVTTRRDTLVNKAVSFSSSNELVANVEENGVVTAVAPGIATITARCINGTALECVVVVGGYESTLPQLRIPETTAAILEETYAGSGVVSVVIPEGVTSIGSRAFADCAQLKLIVIPATVTEIAADAFEGTNAIIITSDGAAAQEYAQASGMNCLIR